MNLRRDASLKNENPFRYFSAACCAWNVTTAQGVTDAATLFSMHSRSSSALRNQVAGSLALIQHASFGDDVRHDRANPLSRLSGLFRAHDHDIERVSLII